jgi:2-methylisocitrate lyase-like PEP mutase family enzyme
MLNVRQRFRQLLADDQIYPVPGVFEGFGALAAESAGFDLLYVTGNGVSASLIGMPDYDFLTMREVVDAHQRIANIVDVPVIGDADTGYGEILNVYRAIQEFERAGIAAVHLEDQASPKKCAYYKATMELISKENFCLKIRAAVKARKDPDFAIIARTDAYRPFGFQETLDRCKSYVEAGADMVYVVGMTDLQEIKAISDCVKVPLMANCNDGAGLALVPLEQLRAVGVKILLYPAILRSAYIKGRKPHCTP